MHILNLGVLQNVCAEGILLMMEHAVFGGLEIEEKLRLIYNDFGSYCKLQGISCSQRRFTAANLHYPVNNKPATDFPFLSAKAFNCRVVLAWLADSWLAHRNQI